MDDRVRELLREMADQVPAFHEVPPRLEPRARRRMAVTIGASALGALVFVLAAVAGLGSLRATRIPEPLDSVVPSPSPPTTFATVVFSKGECAYVGPAEVPSGTITVDVVNATVVRTKPKVLYSALLLIHEGHVYDDLVKWINGANAGSPPPWVTTVDEGETFPGEDDELNAAVTPGTYGLVCATPHSKRGSIWAAGSFTVPE